MKGIEYVKLIGNKVDPSQMYLIEEFFLASLEMKAFDWADFYFSIIKVQFPKSVKVTRLCGMYHEAKDEGAKAKDIYIELINNEPSDAQTVKRLVTLLRDSGLTNDALEVLNNYVRVN